ncbi:hypothetical protein ZHAS_00019482 [Anopheles sinensis]|uniref:Uncharacterized protein n=1 Tax=Anopheles sinensis TaxID=74873 RepID=A0A084WLX3_ANOSI|nr:hypothetical protein ZHAS_00019482 [Anopheles sinensis]
MKQLSVRLQQPIGTDAFGVRSTLRVVIVIGSLRLAYRVRTVSVLVFVGLARCTEFSDAAGTVPTPYCVVRLVRFVRIFAGLERISCLSVLCLPRVAYLFG